MKVYPFAIASVAVLGAAGLLVGSGMAANENSTTASQQLLINQRISQAAVKRSNSSLNYLAPIRTTTTDAANTGANGVTPLSKVAGAGQGWTTTQIANQAITTAKIANGAVTHTQMSNPAYFAFIAFGGTVTSSTSGVTVTVAKTGTSTYTVTFPSNVSACAPQVTLQTFTDPTTTTGSATVAAGTQNTQWVVTTYSTTLGGGGATVQNAASFWLNLQC
ncbi:MAG: hypothetical protein FJW99_05025 [Actinobacteria bacterium]|nr:hypothetical protein [Actinomycetota bacterium]MBM3697539.1 hypothetical protein [Actinomycetota bacterium]